MILRRKKYRFIRKRITKKYIVCILLATVITIVAVITLPYSVWMALIGCILIYIGYELFS